ncbi:hypothetical protein Sps_03365 [Shewanella psychrophila]|uniref:Uncharacterized protein n=1 Tax=Shewanella psychrophila TaxID=225848 RepID=A0A1S6HSL1_9GAMM|nr:hypothetical protein [Shewanella psychrophila]AQS38501.1 hypothetical protein Sps_03365 [Shewanella psychrophila]
MRSERQSSSGLTKYKRLHAKHAAKCNLCHDWGGGASHLDPPFSYLYSLVTALFCISHMTNAEQNLYQSI